MVCLWGVLSLSTAVVLQGHEVYWSTLVVAGALTRLVCLWVAIILSVGVWGLYRRVLYWWDVPMVLLLPVTALSVASLVSLRVRHSIQE